MPVSAAQICLNVSQSIVCINKSSLYIVAVSLNLPLYTALSSFKSVAMFKRDHIKNVDLTLSRRRPLSYRNQSIDLLPKSMDWFLYDNGLRLERVKWKSSKVNDCFISIAMHFFQYKLSQSAINYMFKGNSRNTRSRWNMFKVNNKDTRTTPVASFWCFIVNFGHISHLLLVFLLLTLSK